jgi:hypothetical protein
MTIVIYDHYIFILQATGVLSKTIHNQYQQHSKIPHLAGRIVKLAAPPI